MSWMSGNKRVESTKINTDYSLVSSACRKYIEEYYYDTYI